MISEQLIKLLEKAEDRLNIFKDETNFSGLDYVEVCYVALNYLDEQQQEQLSQIS